MILEELYERITAIHLRQMVIMVSGFAETNEVKKPGFSVNAMKDFVTTAVAIIFVFFIQHCSRGG